MGDVDCHAMGFNSAMVTKLVPGFVVSLSWLPFLFAMMGTLAWGWLVSWRIGKHRSAMWKAWSYLLVALPFVGYC